MDSSARGTVEADLPVGGSASFLLVVLRRLCRSRCAVFAGAVSSSLEGALPCSFCRPRRVFVPFAGAALSLWLLPPLPGPLPFSPGLLTLLPVSVSLAGLRSPRRVAASSPGSSAALAGISLSLFGCFCPLSGLLLCHLYKKRPATRRLQGVVVCLSASGA